MAENTVSQNTSIINANGLSFVESDGQILFSSEEIGRHLGYKNPSKSVNIIFNRNQKELNAYATGIKLMQVDGCYREVRHFTEEGVYILSMLAQTPQAAAFRAKLARLLREIRENRIELARQSGYQQGRDEALALPAVQAERKAGYLAGLREGTRLQKRKDNFERLARALDYRAKGLTITETARLLDMPYGTLRGLLARARALPTLGEACHA